MRPKILIGIACLSAVLLIPTNVQAPTQTFEPTIEYTQPIVISREFNEPRLDPEIAEPIEWQTFVATAYSADNCEKPRSHPEYGITSTGVKVKENHTIAVDPKVIPYGSIVYIEGLGVRYAEDCGGAIKGKELDIYVRTTEEANDYGRQSVNLYVIRSGY